MDERRRDISYLTTIAWFIIKGLKGRRLHITMVAFTTAVAVAELSILFWVTGGIIRFLLMSITFVLSVLAVSEVIVNSIMRKAYRVSIFVAFGAKKWLIALSLLAESAIGSLLGSLTGSIMSLIGIYLLRISTVDLPLHISSIILPCSFGFVIGVLACVYPVLKILEPSISERE